MLELSSFGPRKSSEGPQSMRDRRAGNAGEAQGRQPPGGAEDRAASKKDTGTFPMASFARPSASNESAARRPAAADTQVKDRDRGHGLAAEDDDTAE